MFSVLFIYCLLVSSPILAKKKTHRAPEDQDVVEQTVESVASTSQYLTSGVAREPLVTFEGAVETIKESLYFTLDLVYYGNDKFTESLPTDYRIQYRKLLDDSRRYVDLNISPRLLKAKESVSVMVSPLIDIITSIYDRLDVLTRTFIDPFIQEFEGRYPKQSGLIGQSLADRLILLFWIIAMFKAIKCMICRRCCCRRTSCCI